MSDAPSPTSSEALWVIVSLKHTHGRHLYVTFWRSDRAGYCWPLDWAGRYSEVEAREICDCPDRDDFAVPLAFALRHAKPPKPGYIDGDAGPVVGRRKMATLKAAALHANPETARLPKGDA